MTVSDDMSSPRDPVVPRNLAEFRHQVPQPVQPTRLPHGRVGYGIGYDGQTARPITEVPDHPGRLMPSPDGLRSHYEQAIADIERVRGQALGKGRYGSETRESVFTACLRAFSDCCRSIVATAHPDSDWARLEPEHPEMNVVAAGPGSGKTTYAKAFAVALARLHATHQFPIGCAFLVHHVDTADAFYRELSSLIQGQVAVWTREHDADNPSPEVPAREVRFSVDDLEHHPVIIVTHEFYKGVRGAKARNFTRNGITLPRVLTFIDEKVTEVDVYDVVLSDVSRVREFMQQDDHRLPMLPAAADALLRFTTSKVFAPHSIETPLLDAKVWNRAAEETQWFTTDAAGQYMRSRSAMRPTLPFEQVFGFARCLAENRAFIARVNEGELGTNFVGFELALPCVPGMVLLDATADIDGVSDLCPWRRHTDVPACRYDRLHIIHTESCATGTVRRYLQKPQQRAAYAKHILDLVRLHLSPGQRGLILCMKQMVTAADIPNWSEHVSRFVDRSPNHLWDFEGRRLAVAWWGGYGIGANDWRDADAVFLFDDFHLPKRTVIAMTQAMKRASGTDGPLAFMKDLNANNPDVETIRTGHLLRWLKQMALRGAGREFDDDGICGTQKLILTTDYARFMAHRDRLFPGATLEVHVEHDGHTSWLKKVAEALRNTPEESDEVRTKELAERLGVPWKDISSNVRKHQLFNAALAGAGWSYVSNRGRSGACFRRISKGTPGEDRTRAEPTKNLTGDAVAPEGALAGVREGLPSPRKGTADV
jgi:hypothetical protein